MEGDGGEATAASGGGHPLAPEPPRPTKVGLRMLWQAPPLDLLRLVYQETHIQTALAASGYRTPTWRILHALQSTINANVVVGESIITASAFFKFEGAG